MGGEYRTVEVVGKDFSTAWSQLQDEEREERGSDYYNGSVCHVDARVVSDSEYMRIVKNNDVSKCEGVAKCIQKPIENTNKIKTEVQRFANNGTR